MHPNAPSTRRPPTWHFPPTGGGNAYIEDTALSHFRDRVYDKFVRETLQNSTDARDNGFETVHVEFRETLHSTDEVDANGLIPHIESAMFIVQEEGKHQLAQQYRDAIKALRQPTIRCLDVSDANTTGLQEPQWKALIYKAGSNQKGDSRSAGGTHGIGKFAAFNISLPRTVFYHTCYQKGKGRTAQRVEQWIGKSLLATHQIDDEELQHTGFYRYADREPVFGPHIPTDFRFNHRLEPKQIPAPSTTISIIGFQPDVDDWAKATKMATIINFFGAISVSTLAVTVTDISGNSFIIDKKSIQRFFDELISESPRNNLLRNAHDHYATLNSKPADQTFHMPPPIDGAINVTVRINAGSSRCAYLNANGMLITDAKARHNPFHIAVPAHLPPVDIVVQPNTPSTQKAISLLENISHDQIQISSITDPKSRAQTRRAFAKSRQDIYDWIYSTVMEQQEGLSINISELALVLPDQPEPGKTGPTEIQMSLTTTKYSTAEIDHNASADPEGSPTRPPSRPPTDHVEEYPAQPEPPDPNDDDQPTDRRVPPSNTRHGTISKPRFIAASPHTAAILFDTTSPNQAFKLNLFKRGEIPYASEPGISILSVHESLGAEVELDSGSIVVKTDAPRRYSIHITTADAIDSHAISVRAAS